MLLALAALAALGITNYQPLRSDIGGASGVNGNGVSERGDYFVPGGDPITAFGVATGPGQTFSFWMTIANRGPFGVTLERIGARSGKEGGFPIVEVESNPALQDSNVHRFKPMSLPPGHAVDIEATVRITHCPPAGKRVTFAEMPVTFRVLGLDRHTTLPLPETITIRCG